MNRPEKKWAEKIMSKPETKEAPIWDTQWVSFADKVLANILQYSEEVGQHMEGDVEPLNYAQCVAISAAITEAVRQVQGEK